MLRSGRTPRRWSSSNIHQLLHQSLTRPCTLTPCHMIFSHLQECRVYTLFKFQAQISEATFVTPILLYQPSTEPQKFPVSNICRDSVMIRFPRHEYNVQSVPRLYPHTPPSIFKEQDCHPPSGMPWVTPMIANYVNSILRNRNKPGGCAHDAKYARGLLDLPGL